MFHGFMVVLLYSNPLVKKEFADRKRDVLSVDIGSIHTPSRHRAREQTPAENDRRRNGQQRTSVTAIRLATSL